MSIKLECSIGEALDKLTILNIKLHKIKDERKNDILYEHQYLTKELESIINNHLYYYSKLEEINLEIWELQDKIRDYDVTNSLYGTICCDIINLNDARFIIKKKINMIENSKFKEQKGYDKRIIYVVGLTDKIKLFSIFYDEVYIIININNYIESDYNIYNDDPCIHLITVNSIDDIYDKIDQKHDIYVVDVDVDADQCKFKTRIEHSYIKHKIH